MSDGVPGGICLQWLPGRSCYDLGEVLHMTYLQLERVYLGMRLGGEHDLTPTLSELRNIVVCALWVTRRLVLPNY